MKQHGGPKTIVTGGFRSYRAAMKEIGNWAHKKPVAGSTIEPKFQTNRSDEEKRAMAKFRSMGSLHKFASIHASVHNHFNQERHLYNRQIFKLNRSAALTEWRQLAT